jgi:S-adenosylmethionine decarboxylase proenzyme
MLPLARHTLIEYHDCDPALLRDSDALRPLLIDAVRRGGGTIVTDVFHQFSPHGVSGVIVITESHVAIHTWPEHAFAAVDVFSCGNSLDHSAIRDAVAAVLSAARVESREFARGS